MADQSENTGEARRPNASNPAAVATVVLGAVTAVPLLLLESLLVITSGVQAAGASLVWGEVVFPWPLLTVTAVFGVGCGVAAVTRARRTGAGRVATRWGVALVALGWVAVAAALWLVHIGCGPPDGC